MSTQQHQNERAHGIYIVAYASFLHIPWALVLLANPKIHLATPIAGYFWLLNTPAQVAAMLLAVSAVAFIGKLWLQNTWALLACLVPQQGVLMISAAASMNAVFQGTYPDGYKAPMDFIFNDQWGNILAMVLHTYYVAFLVSKLKFKNMEP